VFLVVNRLEPRLVEGRNGDINLASSTLSKIKSQGTSGSYKVSKRAVDILNYSPELQSHFLTSSLTWSVFAGVEDVSRPKAEAKQPYAWSNFSRVSAAAQNMTSNISLY
jgi:hypothetical protein